MQKSFNSIRCNIGRSTTTDNIADNYLNVRRKKSNGGKQGGWIRKKIINEIVATMMLPVNFNAADRSKMQNISEI